MPVPVPPAIAETNRTFYDALWSATPFEAAQRFNTWPLISSHLPACPSRLEIGPGLRPRLPTSGTHFIDISPPAVAQLNARGGIAIRGEITALPFPDSCFDLVAAFDVIEHVEDHHATFSELRRVTRGGGLLIFSVPLHAALWTEFDAAVGHARRYDPDTLLQLIDAYGFVVEKSAGFGMKPRNPWLLRSGILWLARFPRIAMASYRWIFAPIGLLFQKKLKTVDGFLDARSAQGAILVCRRRF